MKTKKAILGGFFIIGLIMLGSFISLYLSTSDSQFEFMDIESVDHSEYFKLYKNDKIKCNAAWTNGTETILVFESNYFDLFLYKVDGYKGIDIDNFQAVFYDDFDNAFFNPARKIEWGRYELSIESQASVISAKDVIVGLAPDTEINFKNRSRNYSYGNIFTRGFTVSDAIEFKNNIIFRFKERKNVQVAFKALADNFQIFLLVPKKGKLDEKKDDRLDKMML